MHLCVTPNFPLVLLLPCGSGFLHHHIVQFLNSPVHNTVMSSDLTQELQVTGIPTLAESFRLQEFQQIAAPP